MRYATQTVVLIATAAMYLLPNDALGQEKAYRLGLGANHHWTSDSHEAGVRIEGALLMTEAWAWSVDLGWSRTFDSSGMHRSDALTRVEYRWDVLAWVPSARLGAGTVLWMNNGTIDVEPTVQLGWALAYRPKRNWGLQLSNDYAVYPNGSTAFGISTGLSFQYFL